MVIATQHWPGWGTALIARGCVNILMIEDAEWSDANKKWTVESFQKTNKQGMMFGGGDTGGWTEKQDGWKTY
eukprot:8646960-Ditylum_brightwellii.AAC.1